MRFQSIFSTLLSALFLLPLTANADSFAITGVEGYGTHPRLEVRTLYHKKPAQWNIYLLALRALYAEPEHERLSFFQIAGIHGLPNIPWDGVENRTKHGIGYCTHSQNIFTTWHRPYVALYEQRLQFHAMKEARKFSGQDRIKYLDAAKTLRAAYWDWGVKAPDGEPNLPSILTNSHISVHTPDGHEVVPNPFYQYEFHPGYTAGFELGPDSPFPRWNRTLRWPNDTLPAAHSQEKAMISTIQQASRSRRQGLFQWFSNCPKFLEIDDLDRNKPRRCQAYLEDIHGDIHVNVGGGGHMADLDVAGFDPIFWVHHANVDRLFAMWQAVYPDQYVVPWKNTYDTYNYKNHEIIDENTPLTPFHSDRNGTFWTSKQVRDVEVFYYTYPELQNGGNTPAAMRKQINDLYGPKGTQQATGPQRRRRSAKVASRSILPSLAERSTNLFLANNGSSFQYQVDTVSTRFGLGGSYGINFFFADPVSADPRTWAYDPNLVGSTHVLSKAGMEDVQITSTGSVPLADALNAEVLKGNLASMAEEAVIPFLTDKLQWRIVGPAGTEINPADVPSLNILVVASTLGQITDPTEFPVWSPFIPLPQITRGKPGGSGA